MKGYKGFDRDFKCQGFQYEVGKTYEHPGEVVCCPDSDDLKEGNGGFHFCLNPLDVFSYYSPTNRFAIVESKGGHKKHGEDSKVACKKIHIKSEITLSALISAGVKFIFDCVDFTNAPATNTGYGSVAMNTGDRSAATVEGGESVACALGFDSKAKGSLGCWVVIAERDGEGKILTVNSAKVDGEKIKADTFYKLANGEFVEEEAGK